MNSKTRLRLNKIPETFYLQPTLQVAKQLLGKHIVRRLHKQLLVGRIVEVEAYLGERDPASHAYNGKTKRNEVMFKRGGHLYVYFTYGMHFCANVVTEDEGIGHAVLLRALEPIAGIERMARNRGITLHSDHDRLNLCSGPAKLCQALSIGRKENGEDLCGNEIWIAENTSQHLSSLLATSTRVGISSGKKHRWRFYFKDSPFVSKGRPS